MANMMYASDNGGDYTPRMNAAPGSISNRWPFLLYSYYNTTNLLICPSETNTSPITYGTSSNYLADTAARTYLINGFDDGYGEKYDDPNAYLDVPNPFLSESEVPLPSQTILFGEKLYSAPDFFMDYFDFDDGLKVDQVKHRHSIVTTNLGGSVNGLIDGSVVFMKWGQGFSPINQWCTTAYWRTNNTSPNPN